MKKIIKNIIIILILFSMINFNKVDAASAGIYSTDKTVTSGTDKTVTVTVLSSVLLGSYTVQLTDTGGLEFTGANGGELSGDQKTVTSSSSSGTKTLANYSFKVPEVSKDTKYTIKFSLSTLEGPNLEPYDSVTNTATITVKAKQQSSGGGNTSNTGNTTSGGNSGTDSNNTTRYPTESTVNQNKPETPKSSNNYLSSLKIDVGTLTPEFYRETYEYSVTFDENVNLYNLKEINVEAKVEDERAKVDGVGKIQLNDGENTITLNVTAENGSVRTYKIKVVKPQKIEQSELRLKTLVLNGITKSGEYQEIVFELKEEKFEYDIKVSNDITALSINPTTENDDIIIEKVGGESLNEGENKILIILTSPNDETIKTTYTLNIERQAPIVQETNSVNKEQLLIYGAIGLGVLIIFMIIIIVVIKNKRKKDLLEDDEEYDENSHMKINHHTDYFEDEKDSNIKNDEVNNNIQEKEELNTVEDIKPTKLKWDDFCEGYEDEEIDKTEKKKNKGGKRFL